MLIVKRIEELLQRKLIVFLVLFFLVFFQLIYSFIFPSYDASNDYWKTIKELSQEENYSFSSFDSSIAGKISPFLSDYHINSDVGGQILLAHDFPEHYFRGHPAFLHRPLYAFLTYLLSRPLHLINDSYSLTFAAGLLLNFILFLLTAFLFYLLIRRLISVRVAFLSSVLLIFSPFSHIWLVQPETNIFGAFAVILSLYLLYNYLISPSTKKLIIFSLIAGILILGKMFFAVSLFVLILAFYFKRYKEGILFLIIQLIPPIFWYLIVTKVFGLNYSGDITEFNMFFINGWILNIFKLPWPTIFQIVLDAIPSFVFSLIYGFLLLPVIFAIIGFKDLLLKRKNLFCYGFVLSFFVLFFAMNYYTPRHSFLMFPVIYPLAVLGINKIAQFFKKYKCWYSLIFYLATLILLIAISSINIFEVFSYDSGFPWK